MRSLVIGYGEIGKSLHKVLASKYECDVMDPAIGIWNGVTSRKYNVMHICIPPVEKLDNIIKSYKERFKPRYVVIHSTFPVGTAKRLGCYHSPVRGIHPELDKGIQTFVKYLAPKSSYLKKYFQKVGVTIKEVKDSNTTEALKIWDTTIYGLNIMIEKEIYEWCKKHKVDFEMVYTDSNKTYNLGYEKLGHPEYKKYILRQMNGGIGGHCVINNVNFLPDSPLARLLKKRNANYKMSKMSKTSR